MTTILTVIGTRPEAIKMAPVLAALAAAGPGVRSLVCVTGQHRELVDQALRMFAIRPDHDLAVMRPDQGLAELTARLCTGLDQLLLATAPDWVVAQGDTTSVLCAALAAFYRRIPFAHVEAGLRTGLRDDPFPEEFNRRTADLAAALLFAPTERNRANLLAEGVAPARIMVTGNPGIDALRGIAATLPAGPPAIPGLRADRRLALATLHRRESFGAPLHGMCQALARLARLRPDLQLLLPVHPNPQVATTVRAVLADVPGVLLVEPLDYRTLVGLLARCALVLTDSGGLQEEAPALGVPVLVLRRSTERPEGILAGVAELVGCDPEAIVAAACRVLDRGPPGADVGCPYGDGLAGTRIAARLLGHPAEEWRGAGGGRAAP